MPELPEVEEVRRTLEPHLLGKTIVTAELRRPDFLSPAGASLACLRGDGVEATFRHGKKIFLIFRSGKTLLLHLGMTGRVQAVASSASFLPHTHVVLTLDNGRQIRMVDPRRFGGLWMYPTLDAAKSKELSGLGPDALALAPEHLSDCRQTRGRLKARLLSQRDVAGLGSISVDESLFRAGLHPMESVRRIKPELIVKLVDTIREVLQESLRSGGTTLRDYCNVSDQPGEFVRKLRAYGRGGLPCLSCQTALMSAVIAGRTTVWCKKCQKRF
jgi:formamidopyrimidine-DNA glycosylase